MTEQNAPDTARLYAAIEATWPPAATLAAGPWTLREGAGGGMRVSAASARDAWRVDDVPAAEEAMRMMGQTPLFMIRQGDEALDAALEQRGYRIKDPVRFWLTPVTALTDRPLPRVTAFAIWEPLAIMREIWASGGIGAARLAVMDRVQGPKTGIFGRTGDQPAGTGFCAIDGDIAMVHALEILERHRGKGLGKWMMRCAGHWAACNGARWMVVLCTQENRAANALYASLGFQDVGEYHYRILPEPAED
ncbi:GNAT family N-acetyltransferase [Aestuariicoccus sp. MJ-SS9]|uniref:GNAT family N-acetyltransferase n=1 Tax=Aestuariicoccus sp. MJ-SS9 TaxID=3079855 RepID=UPI00290E8C6B|nr:GNAT family N-acetyltransferase [Aestuariicoccus sp. MJ-SS9]MDU8912627.1 GNAT family N-acetyltransferase [Aestuariicoccus sp. MJ-SS9]